VYFPRQTLREHVRWTYDGARWLFTYGVSISPAMIKWRNVVPLLFLLYQAVAVGVVFLNGDLAEWALAPMAGYGVAVGGVSLWLAFRRQSAVLMPSLVTVIASTHYSYGLGAAVGLVRGVARRPRACAAAASPAF